jgi:hypothetical protein
MQSRLEDKVRLCRALYNYKDELITTSESKSNVYVKKMEDSTVLTFKVDNGTISFTFYTDKTVFKSDESIKEVMEGNDDMTYYSSCEWDATFSDDTISINISRNSGDNYGAQSSNSTLNVSKDNQVTGTQTSTTRETNTSTAINEENQKTVISDLLQRIETAIPFQNIVNFVQTRQASVHSFFQENTSMPSPVINIINSYVA